MGASPPVEPLLYIQKERGQKPDLGKDGRAFEKTDS